MIASLQAIRNDRFVEIEISIHRLLLINNYFRTTLDFDLRIRDKIELRYIVEWKNDRYDEK